MGWECLAGMISKDDVDVLFTFNFDLDFLVTLSQGYKDCFSIILLMGTTLYSAHLI